MAHIVLTGADADRLLEARRAGQTQAEVSADLGMTTVRAALGPEGADFPGRVLLDWERAEQIADAGTACFDLEAGELRKIQVYSEAADRCYALMATGGAPTVLNAGIPMHRIKDIDPMVDTVRKIKTIAPIAGNVLDTTTGLGYTAIRAARWATQVTTIERDPAMLELARLNPWSRALFESPNIVQVVADSFQQIREFGDREFSRIIHDPPTFSMAGELYSGEFYRQLCRVLKPNGRVFHYVGDLQSKRGRNLARGVSLRLQEAGFGHVVRRPEAFGLVARK